MSVSFECCVLSGRGLCIGLIVEPQRIASKPHRKKKKINSVIRHICHLIDKQYKYSDFFHSIVMNYVFLAPDFPHEK